MYIDYGLQARLRIAHALWYSQLNESRGAWWDSKTPEQRAAAVRRLSEQLRRNPSPTIREQFARQEATQVDDLALARMRGERIEREGIILYTGRVPLTDSEREEQKRRWSEVIAKAEQPPES